MSGQAGILRTLFRDLDAAGFRYCVIHSADRLPDAVASDLDLALDEASVPEFEQLLHTVCGSSHWRILQRLWYDVPECMYYVLRGTAGDHLAVDILVDPSGVSRYGFTSRELVAGRVWNQGGFYQAAPEVELCYKLVKRARKGRFKEGDDRLLADLWRRSDPAAARHLLIAHFGRRAANEVVGLLEGRPAALGEPRRLAGLSIANLVRRRYARPGLLVHRWLSHARRIAHRLRYATGLRLVMPAEVDPAEAAAVLATNRGVGAAFRRVVEAASPGPLRILLAMSSATLLISRKGGVRETSVHDSTAAALGLAPSVTGVPADAGGLVEAVVSILEQRTLRRLYD